MKFITRKLTEKEQELKNNSYIRTHSVKYPFYVLNEGTLYELKESYNICTNCIMHGKECIKYYILTKSYKRYGLCTVLANNKFVEITDSRKKLAIILNKEYEEFELILTERKK